MTTTIRPATPENDHAFLLRLLSTIDAPPATAAEFADWYAEFPETGRKWEWVAQEATGRTIGYANTTQEDPEDPAFELFVLVDPAFQRQGVGAALLAVAEETARAHGAEHISGNLSGDNPAACAFAERFGYVKERQTIDSRLDLATFDAKALLPGLLEGLSADGIRFETLASGRSEGRLRALYELYTRVAPTFPGATPGAPLQPYERWRERLLAGYEGRWDLVMIALDGERVVGMTRMTPEGSEEVLYTPHTSVDPEYRGLQIGLGLKLYATEVARGRGARFLTTNNDADNEAILTINRRLGYLPTMSALFVGKRVG